MNIGGLLKLSLIDYPGKIAAVIFTQGCNFRCPYCHNPELVLPERFRDPIPEDKVLAHLKKRVGQLEGVVVSGGEPTMQKDLIRFLEKLKKLGYPVKLDTNGSHPDVLKEILRLGLVDFIAMDLKTLLEKYHHLTAMKDCPQRIRESIHIILGSHVSHEFRTTLVKPLTLPEDLLPMVSLIEGAKKYRLQRFIPSDSILDKKLMETAEENFTEKEVADLQKTWGIGSN